MEFRNAFTPSVTSFPAFALNGLMNGTDPYATGTGGQGILSAKDSLYYLKLSAHAYLTYNFPNQSLRGAYIWVGGGLHIIQPATIGVPPIDPTNPNSNLELTSNLSYFDPLVKIGYITPARRVRDMA